jgi:hypothetical protein
MDGLNPSNQLLDELDILIKCNTIENAPAIKTTRLGRG